MKLHAGHGKVLVMVHHYFLNVGNALLNEARTIGVCQILPMSCQTVQPMISAVCFLLRPPKCHCRASRQMDGRRAAPQCEESGAIRQWEKEEGAVGVAFFSPLLSEYV